jgi:predicted DNA-binding transcriptional regulator AlpA
MKPIITDGDTGRELWTAPQCAEHTGSAVSTWRAYVARQQAPATVGALGDRTPLWDAEQVREWNAARPGRGARTDLKD